MLAILLWVAGTIAIISCFIASESPSSIGVLKDPGMLYLGLAIYLVNIINGVFSFVQQFKAINQRRLYQKCFLALLVLFVMGKKFK